jgi:uncharacterized membrane protein
MLDQVLNAIDATNWTHAFILLSIVAAFMIAYVMNLTSFEHEDRSDPNWLQWIRRTGYLLTAVGLLWGVQYMQGHSWQPWPPAVLVNVGIIIGASVRIIAIQLRIRREGSRRSSNGTSRIRVPTVK